jgi:hypothetical protein
MDQTESIISLNIQKPPVMLASIHEKSCLTLAGHFTAWS